MTSSLTVTGGGLSGVRAGVLTASASSALSSAVPSSSSSTTSSTTSSTSSSVSSSAATQRAEAQALATITQVAKATRNAGAAIAQDQLRQLLLRIKVLCLLGGDPKTVARQAAQLAKEVGAAAGNLMMTAGASSTSSTSSTVAILDV